MAANCLVCFCKTAPICVSEASVAKKSLAEGCGWCKGTADAKSGLAVSNASCMTGVQDRVPDPEVASVSGLRILTMPARKRQ